MSRLHVQPFQVQETMDAAWGRSDLPVEPLERDPGRNPLPSSSFLVAVLLVLVDRGEHLKLRTSKFKGCWKIYSLSGC